MRTQDILFSAALLGFLMSPGWGQVSRCADCHFAHPESPAFGHVLEWAYSPHGRKGVGCEGCHGGDASTFESLTAHIGVLNSNNPASPVHLRSLPATCGKCHIGPFVAFQKSEHYGLLLEGLRAPSCSTCHGTVGAHLLSPRGLEGSCSTCHGEGKKAGGAGRPGEAAALLKGVEEAQSLLNQARPLVERISDPRRRAELQGALEQAEVPLKEAVYFGHSFVFEDVRERLETARKRTDALLHRLANP